MYIGNFEIGRVEISIALMILFFGVAMFFIGQQYAYNKAVNYANVMMQEKIDEFKVMYGLLSSNDNPDFILGNITFEDFGGNKYG